MIRWMLTAAAVAASGAALAKLPPLDDAAKAKAAETAAKAAWQGKIDAFLLCKVQDRIAGAYRKTRPSVTVPSGATIPVASAPTAAAAAATTPPAAATPAAAAPSGAASAAAKSSTPTSGSAASSQGGATPAPTVTAGAPPAPGCVDPGPFAYSPPAEKPLETSGAHSPASNASSPPSVRPESAKMAPAQSATPQSKKP